MCCLVESTHKLSFDACVVLINIFYLPKLIFYRQYIRTRFVNFEVENEKIHKGCYGVFSSTCRDDKNELSNKAFEQTWNFTI